MKAAVLTECGKPLEILEGIEEPALGEGQVRVRLAYAGVCHSQVMEARGHRGEDPYVPHLLGHEGTGVVLETGHGVSKVAVGDRVILTWIKGEGYNVGGACYSHGDRTINSGGVTTFSDVTIVSENRLVALPDGINMEEGCLFGCALLTGAGIVLNTLKPSEDDSLLVWGCGGIGLSAVLAAGLRNCKQVIAVDVNPASLELAKQYGASDVIDARNRDAVAAVKKLTGGSGVDMAVESAGRVETIENAFDALARSGTLVFASHPAAEHRIRLDPFELICGKKIFGSWGGDSLPDRDIPILARAKTERGVSFEAMIGLRLELDDINEAIDRLEAGDVVGRCVLKIAGDI